MVKAPKGTCKAALTRANAGAEEVTEGRRRVWSDTIALCDKDKDPELVTASYSGAKSRTSKDSKTAIEWYGKVESQFPTHRLADDARFRAALLLAQGNDEQRAEEMLRTLPDVYPTGDMRTEALFRAALASMTKQDWPTAKTDLDRILEIQPDDHHYATGRAGRVFPRARGGDDGRRGGRALALCACRRDASALVLFPDGAGGAPRRRSRCDEQAAR